MREQFYIDFIKGDTDLHLSRLLDNDSCGVATCGVGSLIWEICCIEPKSFVLNVNGSDYKCTSNAQAYKIIKTEMEKFSGPKPSVLVMLTEKKVTTNYLIPEKDSVVEMLEDEDTLVVSSSDWHDSNCAHLRKIATLLKKYKPLTDSTRNLKVESVFIIGHS